MVLEQNILPYLQWLLSGGEGQPLGALLQFLLVVAGLSLFALFVGYAIAATQRGPLAGGDATYRTVASGVAELLQTTPRRVWALARLAMKEAWRRRVLVALGVYLLILLFANWFLRPDTPKPARLYMSFVLTACTWLVLGVSLFLGAFSLPADFKSKTIYTVATKPVRAGEIVLGRILGFTLVATILLAIMGLASYAFVVRSLDHSHRVDEAELKNVNNSAGELDHREGKTTTDAGHRHDLQIDAEGSGLTEVINGHVHEVELVGDEYQVSAPLGFIQARVPHYGKLRFINRSGAPADKGISVGSEWTYRSFIDGSTPATAIWTFDDVAAAVQEDDQGNEYLPLALTVRVFRTHKGTIGQAITGHLFFRNPETGVTSDPLPFESRDQEVDEFNIPLEQISPTRQPLDLVKDLTSEDGSLEVHVQCLERGQYFGFAQADCYLRMPEGNAALSYAKVIASIWVQAVIVIAVGVTVSTLVSGPVAMLFTFSFILLGLYRSDFLEIAQGTNYGGGPAESVVRIALQANMVSPLEPGLLTTLVQGFDKYLALPFMWCVAQCLPDFGNLSTISYAAEGYNVPWDRALADVTVGLGYVVAAWILGYFLLRTHKVAR